MVIMQPPWMAGFQKAGKEQGAEVLPGMPWESEKQVASRLWISYDFLKMSGRER